VRKTLVCFLAIKLTGVNVVPNPFEHVVVLFMIGVFKNLEKPIVSSDPAAVLGWTGSLAVYTKRILDAWFGIADCLNKHFVFPIVAEVVDICALTSFANKDAGYAGVIGVLDSTIVILMLVLVTNIANHELEEMVVIPAHEDLSNVVQVNEIEIPRHLDSSPNRWLGML